mmetsp:Transcript_31356/g.63750  ORF Transcript_31356/g.63750 Transcript_31356/m.63750 type:complete len:226 (+) Transcript_31356:700-1377(+)
MHSLMEFSGCPILCPVRTYNRLLLTSFPTAAAADDDDDEDDLANESDGGSGPSTLVKVTPPSIGCNLNDSASTSSRPDLPFNLSSATFADVPPAEHVSSSPSVVRPDSFSTTVDSSVTRHCSASRTSSKSRSSCISVASRIAASSYDLSISAEPRPGIPPPTTPRRCLLRESVLRLLLWLSKRARSDSNMDTSLLSLAICSRREERFCRSLLLDGAAMASYMLLY